MSETTKKNRWGHNKPLQVCGVVALAIGVVLISSRLIFDFNTLLILGGISITVGVLWLVCSRFACEEPMRAPQRRYLREFMPAMIAYIVILFAVIPILKHVHAAPLKAVLALLPVVPVVFVMRAMLRLLLGSDELEQKQQLEAISISAMTVALLSFAAAFLQTVGLLPINNAPNAGVASHVRHLRDGLVLGQAQVPGRLGMHPFKLIHDWLLGAQVSRELAADARAERQARQRQTARACMPWLGWLLVVMFAIVLVPRRQSIDWLHALLALALVPPLAVMGWLRMREVLQGDELEQRIELLAMGTTFMIALCSLLLLALLEIFEHAIPIHPLWMFWFLFLGYQLILRLVRARYQ